MIKFKRLLKSFRYAYKGLIKTFKEEQNLRIQAFFAVVVLLIGWGLKIERADWIILVLVIGLVILMELANSAVERVTDMLKPRINTYVKEIKDVTAAAVLVASLVSVIIGIIIFWPYIFCK